jgi:transposase
MYFARLEPCLIGMEACGGAHFWSQELTRLGHTIRMMAPAFVKPYLKTNKNDRNDAEATPGCWSSTFVACLTILIMVC